jgi:hemerythrin-like metal-binding protein
LFWLSSLGKQPRGCKPSRRYSDNTREDIDIPPELFEIGSELKLSPYSPMAFIHWNPNLSVGIDFMDADHQQLITLLTELRDVVGTGQMQTPAIEKLDELIEFSQQHFRLEERLMRENNYREFEQHKALHETLLQEIAELRQRLVSGKTDSGPEIMDFLKDWLIRHILESDKHFGGFLEGRLSRKR